MPRSGYQPLRDTACRQEAKLAVWQGAVAGATTTGPRGFWEDLEDSEDPWTCTLVLSRLRGAAGVHADSCIYSEPVVRMRVPTFSQTARRSKVGIALLKVPFPCRALSSASSG